MKKPKELAGDFMAHWKVPKEGNHVSNSEFVSWCAASMGIGGWSAVTGWLELSAGTATICGLIFQIRWMDVFALGVVGTVLNYVTLPLWPYIMDNMGRFPKKVTRSLLLGGAGVLLLSALLWFMPSNEFFDGMLPDLLKHIALRLAVFVLTSALATVLLRLFGEKYGKFKPFMIFYGPLLLILTIVMVNTPYKDMSYSRLLLVADLLTVLIGALSGPYSNLDNIQGRISPDSQERTRVMSIAPIFTGLLRSIFSIVFPMIAALFGGVENIRTFKIILPVYGLLCLVQGMLVLKVKERVVQEEGHVARAKFGSTLKEVFSNKYQWIKSISDAIGMGPNVQDGLITWMFIYVTRMPWAYGLMSQLLKLPTSFTGQLSAPFFTKRFSKKQNMVGMRFIVAVLTIILLPALGTTPGTWQIVLLMVLSSIKVYFISCHDVISRTITADIWDYQQWKSGERLEVSMGYFGYVTGPLTSLVAYIMPFFMNRVGFLGDMDILYDPEVFHRVISTQILVAVGLMVVSSLPYFFFDLTPKKMERISADLKERAGGAPMPEEEGVTV